MCFKLLPLQIGKISAVLLLPWLLGQAGAAPVLTPVNIPPALEPWRAWVDWGKNDSPPSYNSAESKFPFWPARLNLEVNSTGGRFSFQVQVFQESWISLPGESSAWPLQVKANGEIVPVIPHEKSPAIRLKPGQWQIEGVFNWKEMPQRLNLPKEIGLLALTIEGKIVEFPAWNAEGNLFLRRDLTDGEAEKDFLAIKVYRVIEDGIPMWLRTQIELSVSGKSRETDLGTILPVGWALSEVTSQLPTQVDSQGQLKAQIRAGKWVIQLDAFSFTPIAEMNFASGQKPTVEEELIAFQSKPDFRLIEISGISAIDVSQANFPDKWKSFPVYSWKTETPFQLIERQRGMGLQKPEGLRVSRQMWLDESGKAFTFRDEITGNRQEVWRLNAAAGQQIGSVQNAGEGQLITLDPVTKTPGTELRNRTLNISAMGRMERNNQIPAVGWMTDADALNITMQLPPGWRLFALSGADAVEGDWLTAWTLLDLFLLLIFSLAVFRLWGFIPGLLAFIGFGISFHEPGAPRYIWLALLIPVALLRVVPSGWAHKLVQIWKWLTILILIFILVPFVARQVQYCLYPQLDFSGDYSANTTINAASENGEFDASGSWGPMSSRNTKKDSYESKSKISNLMQIASARIQTGPGVPEWSWRSVQIKWNGPVQSTQRINPILIPVGVERMLTVSRVLLLLLLAGILIGVNGGKKWFGKSVGITKASILLFLLFPLTQTEAQFPSETLLTTLQKRLNPVSDAFPNAADIPNAKLEIRNNRLILNAEIHAAVTCGVPIPGKLPFWSPVTVLLDGQPASGIRREDGYLWLVIPAGVHQVQVEGVLPASSDWEWSFALKPRRVSVIAPDWNVSGINPEGLPESQIFFTPKQKTTTGTASYERQDLQSVALIERRFEMGLVWQVHTTVQRLTSKGKALELCIPVLPGEQILSSNLVVQDGYLTVRLGANDETVSWESELEPVNSIKLQTRKSDAWVERWSLVVSPVWNVSFTGIVPQFNQTDTDLIPYWTPWPGEEVTWKIGRPVAEKGATVTVDRVEHQISIGSRQRTSDLNLSVRSSLGEDFPIGLPDSAEITSLTLNTQSIPVRMDKGKVVLQLRPGSQEINLKWKSNVPMESSVVAGKVLLPVESANVRTTMSIPQDRWVLWAAGPLRGPAVRFWVILICTLLTGWILGRVQLSPLKTGQWMLLAVGLTQVPLPAALAVAGWLFMLSWRGRESFQKLPGWVYNFIQLILTGLTAASLIIFIQVVAAGLLGSPRMFILGNGSTSNELKWYQDRCGEILSQPSYLAISIWWYRLLMLAWALWLALSLLKWLWWGWRQFSTGGAIRRSPSKKKTPPPVPTVPVQE